MATTKTNLVIVESGAKAKTIEKYLKNADELKKLGTFQVVASMGHVVDLPPKEMGIDTDAWEMKYVPIAGKFDIIKKLKKMAKECSKVYLAADPDREGEAIAKNLYDVLGLKHEKACRVSFHEITPRAITEAILHPREIDTALVHAQEARRILDRMVGYKLSPLLWRRFVGSNLSAGRVQSSALRMVVERSKEVDAFKPEPVWSVCGKFALQGGTEADTVLEGDPLTEKKFVEKLLKELAKKAKAASWCVGLKASTVKKQPSAPFTTSSLQQEAYNYHSMGVKRTMVLAQALYEAGHITYMRTDSTSLADDAKKAIHAYIKGQFGKEKVHDRVFQTKVANAQEAHECIRPTHVDKTRDMLEANERITDDHRKLYDLIWRRAVASQMPPAIYIDLKTSITASKEEMPVLDGRAFVGSARVLMERGFLAVWQPSSEAKPEEARAMAARAANAEDSTAQPLGFKADGDVTRPPSLFQEPGLVKTLEKKGIGRPSTYAFIVEKLFSKGYVSRGSNPPLIFRVIDYEADMEMRHVTMKENTITVGGGDTSRFVPTSLGTRVVEYLMEVAPDTVDVDFTCEMEAKLDSISNHQLEKNEMLQTFYHGFEKIIKEALHKQKEAAATRGERDKNTEKRPKNILLTLGNDAEIVKTRYGPALFVPTEKRFISIQPFLEWKGKAIEELQEQDANFLKSLPITIHKTQCPEENYHIHIGRYGMYAKQGDKNYTVSKTLWDGFYDGTISYEELHDDITKNLARPKWAGSQKSGWNRKKGSQKGQQKS